MSEKSEKVTLNIERVIELGEATVLVGENQFIEGTTAYRLGRLGDQCKSVVKAYFKEEEKIKKEARNKKLEALKKAKEGGTSESHSILSIEIDNITIEANDKIDTLKQEAPKEEIVVPKFKLSEFIAKNDVTFEENGVKKSIKTGQTLAPPKFFILMGSYIEDDKNT